MNARRSDDATAGGQTPGTGEISAPVESDRIRLELFVRSLAPDTGRTYQDRVIEQLQELSESDRVESFDLYVCGDCVCPSTVAAETDTGQFLLDRFEGFEEWALQNDVELVGFERRCVQSSFRGEEVTGLRFPRICLAEFVDERVRFVAPSADDGDVMVPDRLDVLEQRLR